MRMTHLPTRPAARCNFHDVADDFGDRLVMLGRDFLVDLDGGVQRAGERRIFHDRDGMLAGHLADFHGHGVDALGKADRSLHASVVLQGDGVVGRVGDDDRGTAAIMRFLIRAWRNWRILPFTSGSPSVA